MRKFVFRLLMAVWFSMLLVAWESLPAAAVDVSRPAAESTKVYMTIVILDMDGVNSADQSFVANVFFMFRWKDPRLVHQGSSAIIRPLDAVWNPKIQIINQQKIWLTFPKNVAIAPDGEVTYRQRAWGSFSQPLALHDFPFDKHRFSIHMVAIDSTPDQIEIVLDTKQENGIVEKTSVADWEILEWKTDRKPYQPIPSMNPRAGYLFSFEAERKTGYFLAKVIIPLILIVAMSWVVFWIDPMESGTQISVAITTMLTLIAYRFAIDTDLPKVSYLTRLDDFILIATILVYASLIEVVVTSTFAKNGNLSKARSIDNWMRWIFPMTFAAVAIKTLVL